MYDNDVFVGRVKNIIQDRGLKQKSVALKAGIAEKAFSDMLNGRRKISPADIVNLCVSLNVTPNELFGISKSA